MNHHNQGYAAIMTTIMTLVVSLTIISAFTFFALQEVNINRGYVRSLHAHYTAESGIEDAVYRVIAGKLLGATQLLTINNSATTITSTLTGNTRTIRSEGTKDTSQNNMETVVEVNTQGVNFFYGVQVGDGGLLMDTTSTITGNVYSNGDIIGNNGAKITGDAIVAGGINANPTDLWTANDSNQSFASTSASRDIAQSFTATDSGIAAKISVYLSKIGNPTNDITLHLVPDDGGVPDNNDIADGIISHNMVASSVGWIDVALAAQPNLVSGTKYWIVLDTGSYSGTNYYNWLRDSTDAYANNTAKHSSDWDAGSPTWTNINADLDFKVWIGGTNTKIEKVTIGDATSGTGRANLFVDDTIHGSACPNAYCIIENPVRQELPITDGVIQDWKDDATNGGTYNGDYNVTSDISLGPKKITGNLNLITNDKILTVTGTIYVQGNITVDNQATIKCAPAYGGTSCIVLADGWIDIKNNGVFQGSGNPKSFLIMLSTAPCNGPSVVPPCDTASSDSAIDLRNNATGAIFYAQNGTLNIRNGVIISEGTAYRIHINQNANVIYDSGLADAKFSSGPSGGYVVRQWHEVP